MISLFAAGILMQRHISYGNLYAYMYMLLSLIQTLLSYMVFFGSNKFLAVIITAAFCTLFCKLSQAFLSMCTTFTHLFYDNMKTILMKTRKIENILMNYFIPAILPFLLHQHYAHHSNFCLLSMDRY